MPLDLTRACTSALAASSIAAVDAWWCHTARCSDVSPPSLGWLTCGRTQKTMRAWWWWRWRWRACLREGIRSFRVVFIGR
eukprot:355041-Chlamydomonas_euryale.AAC.4